ncbi:uncharacterized protein LOC142225113 [Haematobia irritans]|uniref:uncharacterized protein LOC142225113 n=1 Tax=Haematobia irritans TaxID=7368 RepID=UPI003F4F5572
MLGFIKRNCGDFSDPNTWKIVYTAYVRSRVEYASIVWDPRCNNQIARIERVQRVFVEYALKSLPISCPSSYFSNCLLLGLQSLEDRRKVQSALFVFDLINNVIDCPDLLLRIPLYVPPRTMRYVDIFEIPLHRKFGKIIEFSISKNDFKLYFATKIS